MALWVSCGSIRDRKITVQGFSLPKICTRISCFLQIKLHSIQILLAFPFLAFSANQAAPWDCVVIQYFGNFPNLPVHHIRWIEHLPENHEGPTLCGAFFLFHFCVRSWPRWFIAGLFWHVAPYQFCEKPPLGNMSRNKRKKKGTYNFIRQKPGGGGVAGDHSWWNK